MDSNPRIYLHGYFCNPVISMKSQSKWGRIGKIIVILLAFYISISIAFEYYLTSIWIPAYFNPVLIALSLTLGYFVSMLLNLVKSRFLPMGALLVAWGLFSFWIGEANEAFRYLGIALVIVGAVITIAPLLIRSRVPI